MQLEGLESTKSALQREINELKQTNTELTRQLSEWRALDKRGGDEAASERAKRVELEVKIRRLEEEMDEKDPELEKERKKREKVERSLEKYKAVFEEQKVRKPHKWYVFCR